MKIRKQKTVLITVHSVNPLQGSEDSFGWHISKEIAKDYKVILLTNRRSIPLLHIFLSSDADVELQNMIVLSYDLPEFMVKFLQSLGFIGSLVYNYLWQIFIVGFIKRKNLKYDLAHALSNAKYCSPTFLWVLKKPIFWGPIGHDQMIRKDFIFPVYGRLKYWANRVNGSLRWILVNLDPFFWLAQKNVNQIFVDNNTVKSSAPQFSYKMQTLPSVAALEAVNLERKISNDTFRWLSISGFHYSKGVDIVIKAFAEFLMSLSELERIGAKLILIGSGAEERLLRKLTVDLRIENFVEWHSFMASEQLENIYLSSDIFVCASHESVEMSIPQALSYGLPILCYDNDGPGELVGNVSIKIAVGSPRQVVSDFARAARRLYNEEDLYKAYSSLSISRFKNCFTWRSRANKIKTAYSNALESDERIASSCYSVS